MKDISIALVNYHCEEKILRSLVSLLADISECPYKVGITVVDNSTANSTLRDKLASSFPQVSYIPLPTNVGFGKAGTIAFKTTPARYYFSLNPDTRFLENNHTIASIITFMDAHPEIGCIGPKLLNRDGSVQYSCFRFNLMSILIKPFRYVDIGFVKRNKFITKHIARLLMQDFDHNQTRPVDWVLGAAMILRKEIIEKIGWFDERFFLYFEDCDWCRRVWEAGSKVYYVPTITIEHDHARGSAEIHGIFRALIKNKLARIHAISWIKYLLKWLGKHRSFSQ